MNEKYITEPAPTLKNNITNLSLRSYYEEKFSECSEFNNLLPEHQKRLLDNFSLAYLFTFYPELINKNFLIFINSSKEKNTASIVNELNLANLYNNLSQSFKYQLAVKISHYCSSAKKNNWYETGLILKNKKLSAQLKLVMCNSLNENEQTRSDISSIVKFITQEANNPDEEMEILVTALSHIKNYINADIYETLTTAIVLSDGHDFQDYDCQKFSAALNFLNKTFLNCPHQEKSSPEGFEFFNKCFAIKQELIKIRREITFFKNKHMRNTKMMFHDNHSLNFVKETLEHLDSFLNILNSEIKNPNKFFEKKFHNEINKLINNKLCEINKFLKHKEFYIKKHYSKNRWIHRLIHWVQSRMHLTKGLTLRKSIFTVTRSFVESCNYHVAHDFKIGTS